VQELKDCRILVVEDDTLVAWDIEALLQDAGGTVVGPVGRLAQALELVTAGEFDIALLDLNLGADNSLLAADRLEEAGIPFIFLSGHSAEFLPERHRHRPLVAKPFHPRLLLDAILDARAGAKA
jgi:CheY-like chemotaxis protein